ncbi:MAG: glycosyltransferase, partial [Clostridia bacterium]|nr:glycosyltransferase [Clostridia bacterium]
MEKDKKLNIGLFLDTYYPMIDGVISVVDNYAKRLVKYANVTVFTIAPRDKKYKDNFPYKVVRSQKLDIPALDYDLAMPGLDSKFQKELKNSHLDIVHIHSPFSIGKIGLNYAKKHKIPCVATNHSQFKQDFFKATQSPAITDMLLKSIMNVFNACDENWSVNKEVANVYDEYGLKKHAKVVNNATDMELLTDKSFLQELRKKHNIKDDDKVFLFVGRLTLLKNIFFILD